MPLIDALNDVSLDHLTVHPRIAKEQYSGALHEEAFCEIYENSKNPVVFNGDILCAEDAANVISRFPDLAGIMIGRGALGRPSVFNEIIGNEEWDESRRKREMLAFHRKLFAHYQDSLIGGSHQVLDKIRPFWDYAEAEIGRKAWKGIKKASNISNYQTALANI